MRSLCVFVHYSEKEFIPEYVLTYINELKKYFTDVIVATNNRPITNIHELNNVKLNNVKLLLFKNEGYDFGLFYKSIYSTNLKIYNRVAFINDSNILLKPLTDVFDWKNSNELDVWGLTDSYENVPNSKHIDSYHIQSHFLVFEETAISYLYNFFNFIKFDSFFNLNLEKRELWLKIIEDCEIGISVYMRKHNLKLGAKYACEKFVTKGNYKAINIHMILWKELLENNYPLIKKKIVNQAFDPIYEKHVANKIDANSAEEYISRYKRSGWKCSI